MTGHFQILQERFPRQETLLLSFMTIEAYGRLRSKSGEACISYDETQYFVGPETYGITSMNRRVEEGQGPKVKIFKNN